MSRTFVREVDLDGVVVRSAPMLPDGVLNRVTPAGARRLWGELRAARTDWRALEDDASALARARRVGLEARVRWLEQRVASLIETSVPRHAERVEFGATVVVEDRGGQEHAWQIVGVDEAAPLQGRVSWTSPLGRALLGARLGDAVRVRTRRGSEEVEILEIRPG